MIDRMRTLRQSFFKDEKPGEPGHKGYRFLTAEQAREQGYGRTPSKSYNRGRQPGSWKRKRDTVRRSRRRNRGAKKR